MQAPVSPTGGDQDHDPHLRPLRHPRTQRRPDYACRVQACIRAEMQFCTDARNVIRPQASETGAGGHHGRSEATPTISGADRALPYVPTDLVDAIVHACNTAFVHDCTPARWIVRV